MEHRSTDEDVSAILERSREERKQQEAEIQALREKRVSLDARDCRSVTGLARSVTGLKLWIILCAYIFFCR